ncbi:hypothetical protein GCK32_007189 [Trichostrongylus colubriformis]|uniref:Uncharacterized protein n=1 Tax=Trichostrongylus colubriformis TaxID=6319 RepID=A0AAN8F5H6_TRICO
MRTSLSELRKSVQGKPYLISSFRYKNLVVFCDGSMTFVYGLVNNNGIAEYTRSVRVLLSPRLPDDVEITSMSVMHDGSLVVLSSANSLFIVRISADLWISRAGGNVPHCQYICEVNEVHPTLFDSPRPPKVLRLRWIITDSMNSSIHLLAVLFDDNRIRIYIADNICDVPFATIEYASFMCASDRIYEGYGSGTYGFFKSIVSFDCIVEPEEAPVVIAIDSEGEMYSTVISLSSSSPVLTRPLVPPSNLPCDPVDLRLIDHPMSELFSVAAVFSASNTISFVVAVPDEHVSYSLFLHEQLQLPQSGSWNLCSGSFESTILIANESTVFHMDISPWLEDYAEALGVSSTAMGPSPSVKSTIARELISTSRNHEKSELPYCACPSNERAVGLMCTSTTPRDSTTMFIACTNDPPLATAFLRRKTMDSQISYTEHSAGSKEMHPNFNEKVLNAILSRRQPLPQIVKAPSEQQLLKNLTDFFDSAYKNQVVLRAALEMSQDRLNVLVNFAAQLTERQNLLNQRLLQVFRQNVSLKERNELLHSEVTKTLSRVDRVTSFSGFLSLNRQPKAVC